MLRVSHNYVHKDFSYLLNMPCVAAPAATASATAAKVTVSPAKRRRDSLLSNRNMKYIISKAGDECHDRDCPSAVSIPDELFDMCHIIKITVLWHIHWWVTPSGFVPSAFAKPSSAADLRQI